MKQKLVIALLTVAGAVGVKSFAQTNMPMAGAQPGTVSPTPAATASPATTSSPGALQVQAAVLNSQAINVLHHINNLEIQEATQAQANLQNTGSQTYAQMLITDHQASEQQVQQLAAQQGISLYVFQPATYETALDSQLTALAGTTIFDQAFLQGQVLGHQRALENVQLLQGLVVDPQIKTLLNNAVTTIQRHRDEAARLVATPNP
jgi:predicted outer membrane protein